MLSNFSFVVSQSACLKDPTQSDLGKKILCESINLLNDIGLEYFTFKKLSNEINSTESSVYRYFENKHKLLVYIANWYWSWLQNKILVETYGHKSAFFKLERSIELLASPVEQDMDFDYIDQKKLYKIIISEGPKVHLIKDVDTENDEGVYLAYKGLCSLLSDFILSINPKYKHSHTLASTIVETCHNQIFFSEHLPRLTDVSEDDFDPLKDFLIQLTSATIQ